MNDNINNISLINTSAVESAVCLGSAETVVWTGISRGRELSQRQKSCGAEYVMARSEMENISAVEHFVRASAQAEFVVRLMRQKALGETISAINWDWSDLQDLYGKAQQAAWFSAQVLNRLCVRRTGRYLLADLTKYQTSGRDTREWNTLRAAAMAQLYDAVNDVTSRIEEEAEQAQ